MASQVAVAPNDIAELEAEFRVMLQATNRSLGVSNSDQDRLTQSANNLSPLEGGRHARTTGVAPWSLED